MPQGKGTYGSQVGRPSKKKKYEGGGSIDPFSTKNPDSLVINQAIEELKDQSDIPTANAMERSQSSPMGNEVGTGTYKEGGKVDITDVVKAVEASSDATTGDDTWDDLHASAKKLAIKAGYKIRGGDGVPSESYKQARKDREALVKAETGKIKKLAKKALHGKKKK